MSGDVETKLRELALGSFIDKVCDAFGELATRVENGMLRGAFGEVVTRVGNGMLRDAIG